MLRVGIVAGEISGDLLGADLIKAVHKIDPDIKFEGIAGDAMQAAGCEPWYKAEDLAVMGLTEVLKDLPRLLSIKKNVLQRWIKNPPDLFIGIDAPDFNLRLAKQLKAAGIHTAHYVSPSVWAWREGRVKTIEKAVNDLFCLLPFEPDYYKDTSVNAHFVGHPMADRIEPTPQIDERKNFQVPFKAALIAVLPGSRSGEIDQLAQPFIQCVALLAKRYPKARFSIPLAKPKFKDRLQKLLERHAPGVPVSLLDGQASELLAEADVSLIASGTATLEAMLHACPMVVGYRVAASTAWLLNTTKALKTKYFSLPNILADKLLVSEVLQKELTPLRLANEISLLLEDPKKVSILKNEFKELHKILQQNTSERVADIILSQLTTNSQ